MLTKRQTGCLKMFWSASARDLRVLREFIEVYRSEVKGSSPAAVARTSGLYYKTITIVNDNHK